MLRLFSLFSIYMCVLLFDVFNGCSSSSKEINMLINKGMCVDVFNGCSLVQLKKKIG